MHLQGRDIEKYLCQINAFFSQGHRAYLHIIKVQNFLQYVLVSFRHADKKETMLLVN